jgi:type III pantothenate kinase
MSQAHSHHRRPLVSVDVGNSRTKLGLFVSPNQSPLPVPQRMFAWGPPWRLGELDDWLAVAPAELDWCIGSVNRPGCERILSWLRGHGADDVRVLEVSDMPLAVEVDEPDAVGIDRLANTLAAGRLRPAGQRAIVVAFGTAITVDLVGPQGAFEGGAILPGIAMAAKALHDLTDLLPLEPMWELGQAPSALGKTTSACLQAGLYWGSLGGVRELVAQLTPQGEQLPVFVTGSIGPAAAALLGRPGQPPPLVVPHLTLAGIALAARPD